MGRWGYTMFQGDTDHDIVSEFESATDVSMHDPPEQLAEARKKLDAGLSMELMQMSKERLTDMNMLVDTGYTCVILAAFMMHVGARIAPEDRQHIKKVLPGISSKTGFVLPIGDSGFRDPGKAQFTAALENYVDGERRDFFLPSCFGCGKTNRDIAPAHLKKCQACVRHSRNSFYCDKECQTKDWKSHKHICGSPRQGAGFVLMNV